jgi:hypothetical protein
VPTGAAFSHQQFDCVWERCNVYSYVSWLTDGKYQVDRLDVPTYYSNCAAWNVVINAVLRIPIQNETNRLHPTNFNQLSWHLS